MRSRLRIIKGVEWEMFFNPSGGAHCTLWEDELKEDTGDGLDEREGVCHE